MVDNGSFLAEVKVPLCLRNSISFTSFKSLLPNQLETKKTKNITLYKKVLMLISQCLYEMTAVHFCIGCGLLYRLKSSLL